MFGFSVGVAEAAILVITDERVTKIMMREKLLYGVTSSLLTITRTTSIRHRPAVSFDLPAIHPWSNLKPTAEHSGRGIASMQLVGNLTNLKCQI